MYKYIPSLHHVLVCMWNIYILDMSHHRSIDSYTVLCSSVQAPRSSPTNGPHCKQLHMHSPTYTGDYEAIVSCKLLKGGILYCIH